MTNPLEYKEVPVPEGAFKISPSAFANFVSYPHKWYRSQVTKEEVFDYNTSSVIGTCVHYCAEKVAKKEEVNIDDIIEYIESKEEKEDYSIAEVKEHWQMMAERLVNDYVNKNIFLEVEKQICIKLEEGFYAAGTCDAIHGTKEECMLVDYKTYNSKTKVKAIPQGYKYQLLVYAWMLHKAGYNVTRIRLTYINRNIDGGISEKTGKPLKSYPPEVTELTEMITQEDLDFIEGLLYLAVDSVKAGREHPELLHVIFHDPRLRQE